MPTNDTSQKQAAKNLMNSVEQGDQKALNDLARLVKLRDFAIKDELSDLIHNLIVNSARGDKKAKKILQKVEALVPHHVVEVRVNERKREFWHLINLAKLGNEEATVKVVEIVKLNHNRLEKVIRKKHSGSNSKTTYSAIAEANSGPIELRNGKLAHALKEIFLSTTASQKQKQTLWTLENCIVNLYASNLEVAVDDEGNKQTLSSNLIPEKFGAIIRRHFEKNQKR